MDRAQRIRLSKRLSYHLRHDPAAAGLELDPGGWTSVDDVLAGVKGLRSRKQLEEVISAGGKRRFELSGDGRRIRARYGHSVAVDPAHERTPPPDVLYHGTAERNLDRILRDGLQPMGRQQVHLSERREDATEVGRRHGRPVILEVAARRMHEEGFVFSRATDGVWLVDEVPPRHVSRWI